MLNIDEYNPAIQKTIGHNHTQGPV